MHYRHRVLSRVWFFTLLALLFVQSVTRAETWSVERIEKAKKLYLTKCSKCHRLYVPKEYDDATWSEWMEKMKTKAHLNEDQYEQISHYLESLRKG